jgi:hypothetical protein
VNSDYDALGDAESEVTPLERAALPSGWLTESDYAWLVREQLADRSRGEIPELREFNGL